MNCPYCNSEISADAKFCTVCGANMPEQPAAQPAAQSGVKKCPYCNSDLAADAKFCTVCGANMPEQPAAEPVGQTAEQTAAPWFDPGESLGKTSMILGIVGLAAGAVLACACACLGGILPLAAAITAIVLGIIAMSKSKAAGYSNKKALTGIITGAVAVVVIILFIALNGVIGAMIGLDLDAYM